MSIMVGATSGKFVMIAAILLFQARVDGDPVPAAVAPGRPASTLSPRLSEHLSKHRRASAPVKIGIRGNYFYAAIDQVDADRESKADLVIGQDILASHPIEIDFARHELASLLPGELRARQRRDHAITLRPDGAGHWRVSLELPNGRQVEAMLDLSRAEGIILGSDVDGTPPPPVGTVKLNGVALRGVRIWRAAHDMTKVGLGAFPGRRVILDLGHDRIWIDG